MVSADSVVGWSEDWPAPAKLNLMLRVVGRRSDRYHELQTVFQFIDRCDLLAFRPRSDGVIRRTEDIPGLPQEQDLVVRAARLLREHGGCEAGADIRIQKRLPMGGGLGGGSSDAATTLVALNRLWGLELAQDELAGLGLRLGADVPVFVRGLAAWGEGVGERLRPVELPCPWYLVLVPDCHVSTAAVFNAPELTRDAPRITIPDFLAGEQGNACVSVVRRNHPKVAQALDWLDRFAEGRLTGTGACVFAQFDDEGGARELAQQAGEKFSAFVARGINRSPLLDRSELSG
jgi:4-diphosphocytidyl-2-C-methyl-D-erythritol kinase